MTSLTLVIPPRRQMYVRCFSKLRDLTSLFFQAEVVIVGRITLDSESTSGTSKLNEASLCLESSRMMGSGVRVPIKFESDVKVRGGPKGFAGVGLFPGAIAALKGKNGGGGWFSVTELLSVHYISCTPIIDICRPTIYSYRL